MSLGNYLGQYYILAKSSQLCSVTCSGHYFMISPSQMYKLEDQALHEEASRHKNRLLKRVPCTTYREIFHAGWNHTMS